MDYELLPAQDDFIFCDSPFPCVVGGLGCMRATTKIITRNGLKFIADLKPGDDVLSWSEKNQKFLLSPASGAFPKGKENLYRVVTTRGEFFATGSHLVFSHSHKYQPVHDLRKGMVLSYAPSYHQQTISELSRIWSPSNDLSYWKTLLNCQDDYELLSSRYGQQLQLAINNAQSFAQQQDDAQKSLVCSYLLEFLRKGDLLGQSQTHSHLYQSFDRQQKRYFFYQLAKRAGVLVNQTQALSFGHIFDGIQEFLKSQASLCSHHIKTLLTQLIEELQEFSFLHSSSLVLVEANSFQKLTHKDIAYSSQLGLKVLNKSSNHHKAVLNFHADQTLYNSTTKAAIIHIERLKSKEWFYDMHVAGTNNYVSEDGAIHHNSGKSRAGTLRMVVRRLSDPGSDGAYYMPSYDLLNLRAIPGVQEDLEMFGIGHTLNKSKYEIEIHGFGKIIFRSYDRPERIIAYEVADSIVDELDTLPKDKAALVWRKVSERNRQKREKINTIGCVTTCDQGYNGFVYEKWEKKKQDGYILFKASTYKNKHLPDGYIDQIIANYDPILADLYLNGNFVSLNQSRVYHFFDRAKHNTQREIKEGDLLHIGLDFNIGGCCATVFVIDNNNPACVGEFTSHDTRDFVNNLAKYKSHKIVVYPDASGNSRRTNASQSDIEIIREGGFQVRSNNNNPAIRDRINAVNGLLAHNRLSINTSACPNLTNALETQGYDKNGDPEKWADHPAIDDWNDSLGYCLHTLFPVRNILRTNSTVGHH